MKTDWRSLKPSEVSYIATSVKLIPILGITQTLTISNAALGVFKLHDEFGNERKLYPFIFPLSLRCLKVEGLWSSTCISQQAFVLYGLRELSKKPCGKRKSTKRPSPMEKGFIPMELKGLAVMKATDRPKVIDKEHITGLANLLNESWRKLKIDVFDTNRIRELSFIEDKICLSDPGEPRKENPGVERTGADVFIRLMKLESLNSLLNLSETAGAQNRRLNLWTSALCSYLPQPEGPGVQDSKTSPFLLLSVRKHQKRKIIIDEDDESDDESDGDADDGNDHGMESDNGEASSDEAGKSPDSTEGETDDDADKIKNSLTEFDFRTTKNKSIIEENLNKLRKSRPNSEPEVAGEPARKKRRSTSDSIEPSYEQDVQGRNWARSKEILHRLHVEGIRFIGKPEQLVKTESNGFEFSIAHRSNDYIMWKPPTLRSTGWEEIVREDASDFINLGYNPSPNEYLWKGVHSIMGTKEKMVTRLYEDADRNYSTLNPSFRQEGTLKRPQRELSIPSSYTHLNNLFGRKISNKKVHILVLLRSIGFRLPHRLFLTRFSIDQYEDVTQGIICAILLHQGPRFQEIHNAFLGNTDGLKFPFTESIISGAIRECFRDYRCRLDTAGFVVFSRLFKSLIGNPQLHKSQVLQGTARKDKLSKNISAYFEFWLKRAPTSRTIQESKCSVENYLEWTAIRNTEADPESQISDESRLMQTKHAISSFYENVERKNSRIPILQAKCFIEACIMQLSKWLQLEDLVFSEDIGNVKKLFETYQKRSLSSPDLGGEF